MWLSALEALRNVLYKFKTYLLTYRYVEDINTVFCWPIIIIIIII